MPASAYVIAFLVVSLTALFAVAYHFVPLYWAYQATDAYLRARRVREQAAKLGVELRSATEPVAVVPSDAIRAEAFRNVLRESPVYYLKAYPGIGEATMQRIRDAGYDNIHDVQELLSRTPFPVPGIGASRAADIRSAIRADLQKRRQWFDAGDNSHARRAEAEITRLTAERDARIAGNGALASRLRQDMDGIQSALKAAAKVSFWSFLSHRRAAPNKPWPYDPILDVPLSQVEPLVIAAPPIAVTVAPTYNDIADALRGVIVTPPMAGAVALPSVAVAAFQTPMLAPNRPKRLPQSVEAIATLLYSVARADGRLAAAERAAVRRGLAKVFEHDSVLVRFIDPALELLASATLDIDGALRYAVALSRRDRDLLRRCADEVASATATRHAARDAMLARFAQALTLPGEGPVPPAAPDPSELRSNELLDGLFDGPTTPATVPVAAGQNLRDNALLDDVFGGR